MKKRMIINLFLILLLFAGLSLLLYPSISDYWNSFHQSRAISSYAEAVSSLDENRYAALWQEAKQYNQSLLDRPNDYLLSEEQFAEYESLLNVSGTGVMGYVDIPGIDCTLPIYHGTGEGVLQVAVGHLEWTSLPVGGEGTHCVLSGHRGLPSAKLFTDLDKMEVGDTFDLCILNETLTYEVDQIMIVEPHETSALQIVPGEDYCTLVTCTPYAKNTHRLLVRGHRMETESAAPAVHITADAVQVEPLRVAPLVAAIILFFILLIGLIQNCRIRMWKKRGGGKRW